MDKTLSRPFRFKAFEILQEHSAMKVGTDGVLLGAWARHNAANKILDIGTGTGVIAIMLAQRFANASVTGVEIDEAASREAMENMKNSPYANRLEMVCSPIQKYLDGPPEGFDLIVSNPPFFSGGTLSYAADRNEVRHTAKLPHGDLIHSVNRLLHPHGIFCLILPQLEGLRFVELAQRARLYPQRITEVKPKAGKEVNRLLIAFGRNQGESIKDQLTIRMDGENDFTPEYKSLTKDFYLNF